MCRMYQFRELDAAARQLVGGAGEWRVGTGECRTIYEIRHAELVVPVVKVGRRRDVHERR